MRGIKKKYSVCYLFNFIDIHTATSSIEIGADHAMPLMYHPHMIHVYIAFVKMIHLHFFLVNMNVNHMIHEEIHDFIKEIALYIYTNRSRGFGSITFADRGRSLSLIAWRWMSPSERCMEGTLVIGSSQ